VNYFMRYVRATASVAMIALATPLGMAHDELMIRALKVLHPGDRDEIALQIVSEMKRDVVARELGLRPVS
jgi:hypothetical protein